MRESSIYLLAFALVLAAACIESNPQPSPGGGDTGNGEGSGGGLPSSLDHVVNGEKVLISAPTSGDAVIAVGDAKAATDADEVRVNEDDDSGEAAGGSFGVQSDGSFFFVLEGYTAPVIKLTFVYPDSDDTIVVEFMVPAVDDDAKASPAFIGGGTDSEDPSNFEPPGEYDGWADEGSKTLTVTALQGGAVEVSGTAFSTTPFSIIAVGNLTLGDKVVVQADNLGEFVAILNGVSGDKLALFAVNPADQTKASQPAIIVVP